MPKNIFAFALMTDFGCFYFLIAFHVKEENKKKCTKIISYIVSNLF